MGNISVVISVAPVLGPTISGAVLAFAPWRMLFVLVLPTVDNNDPLLCPSFLRSRLNLRLLYCHAV